MDIQVENHFESLKTSDDRINFLLTQKIIPQYDSYNDNYRAYVPSLSMYLSVTSFTKKLLVPKALNHLRSKLN